MDAVPSNKRASELEQYGMRAEANTMVEDAEQDGWVAPPATQDTRDAEEIPSSHPESAAGPSVEARTDAEDDIPDIDDLELEDDEAEKDEVGFLISVATIQTTNIYSRMASSEGKDCAAGNAASGRSNHKPRSRPGPHHAHAHVRPHDHVRQVLPGAPFLAGGLR